jgi:hypothetical protein
MKIGIDINHVLRDVNSSFLRQYDKEYGIKKTFRAKKARKLIANLDVWHNKQYVPFDNNEAMNEFRFIDHAYEIYGTAGQQQRNLSGQLLTWKYNLVVEKATEPVELIAVSPDEDEIAAMSTLFFLAKGFRIGHVLIDTKKRIWDECDVIITANPKLIKKKPEGKIVVKIKREFNKNAQADLEYESLSKLMNDQEFFDKLNTIKNHE